MAEVRWTPHAADDLEAIADFIAVDSSYYARLFVLDVMSGAEQIAQFPQAGRMVPELKVASVRELIIGNYRLVYRIQRDVAEILTVVHGARLLRLP